MASPNGNVPPVTPSAINGNLHVEDVVTMDLDLGEDYLPIAKPTQGERSEPDGDIQTEKSGTEEPRKAPELPPPCKKCFIKFASKKSVTCPHEFCSGCWETMVKLPLATTTTNNNKPNKESKNSEENDNPSVFTCSVCGVSNYFVRPKSAYPMKQIETLSQHVKRLKSFKVALKRRKLFPEAMVFSTSTDEFILVDCTSSELLILTRDGEVKRHFAYLKNHFFQGGLAVDSEGIIRIALRNDRFSGVSYYTNNGKFKYSAFLYDKSPHVGEIVSLDLDKHDNMFILDKETKNICYVSKEKQVESHPIFTKALIEEDIVKNQNQEESQRMAAMHGGQEPDVEDPHLKMTVPSEAHVVIDNDKEKKNAETEAQKTTAQTFIAREGKEVLGKVLGHRMEGIGLTSIAVNSWGQVLLCDQSALCATIREKQQYCDVEVGQVDFSDLLQAQSRTMPVLKVIVDEHNNLLLLDRSSNRVQRYKMDGMLIDTLVQLPTDSVVSVLEDNVNVNVCYSLKDIACTMKGTLCLMHTCEQRRYMEKGCNGSIDKSDESLGRRTEICLYSYSTPRNLQSRKVRKLSNSSTGSLTHPQKHNDRHKSKICVII